MQRGAGFSTSAGACVADDVVERLGLPRSMFPNVHASADLVGQLTLKAATALGLPHGIPVSAGCTDQPAQAVGNGLIDTNLITEASWKFIQE